MASAADTDDLNRQSTWMAVFSVIYTGSAALAYRVGLGDSSLVYANMLNLGVRIVYTAVWISGYFKRKGQPDTFRWRVVFLSAGSWLLLAMSGLIIRLQRTMVVEKAVVRRGYEALISRETVAHVAVGGLLGVVALWQTTRSARTRVSSRSKVE